MKLSLLPRLVCPECGSELTLTAGERDDSEVRTGMLTCVAGKHHFPIIRSVPRFVDADKYADSFSRQRLYVRRHFEHYRHDTSGDQQFEATTGITNEALRAGLSLEVGCGYGRFLDVVQRRGGEIVGIDLSTHSADLAFDFVGNRPNVHVVQCDLFKLPFRKSSFQNIFSIGVLHHTPDTRRAFEAVVPFVKPEGRVSIWVYSPAEKTIANRWRPLTTRLNHRVLYGVCVASQFLFSWIRALPGGWRFSHIVPGGAPRKGQSIWLRVLGDFDSLAPVYAHVHSPAEVREWFTSAGLSDVTALSRQTAVTGRRASPPHSS